MSSAVKCPDHPDANLIEDHRAGDLICPQCGLVVGERVIDVSSEWRSFNNEKSTKDPSRVGAPENPLLSGSDLSTNIVAQPGTAGFELALNQRRQMNSSDRHLIAAFQIIRDMASRSNISSSIIDDANLTFKQAVETKTVKGKSTEAMAAACLYIACRKQGVPRTFKEICAVSNVNKKEIGRAFKLILKALEQNPQVITAEEFMTRFCANLDLPHTVMQAATQIARKAIDLGLVAGRSPISIAAAAIYMASSASDVKKSAKEIGEVAGVAEVTIKQSYKLMYPRAADLFPADFRFATAIQDLPVA